VSLITKRWILHFAASRAYGRARAAGDDAAAEPAPVGSTGAGSTGRVSPVDWAVGAPGAAAERDGDSAVDARDTGSA
jgi:hypothetical protein